MLRLSPHQVSQRLPLGAGGCTGPGAWSEEVPKTPARGAGSHWQVMSEKRHRWLLLPPFVGQRGSCCFWGPGSLLTAFQNTALVLKKKRDLLGYCVEVNQQEEGGLGLLSSTLQKSNCATGLKVRWD